MCVRDRFHAVRVVLEPRLTTINLLKPCIDKLYQTGRRTERRETEVDCLVNVLPFNKKNEQEIFGFRLL